MSTGIGSPRCLPGSTPSTLSLSLQNMMKALKLRLIFLFSECITVDTCSMNTYISLGSTVNVITLVFMDSPGCGRQWWLARKRIRKNHASVLLCMSVCCSGKETQRGRLQLHPDVRRTTNQTVCILLDAGRPSQKRVR